MVSGSLTIPLRPIYSLLLSTILMTVFYALFSWRSYVERERYIQHLRPFVASQRLYEQLLATFTPPTVDTTRPFYVLCDDVLEARSAYLAALGPLALLAGPPLRYPDGGQAYRAVPLHEITAQFDSPQTMCVLLDPARYGGRDVGRAAVERARADRRLTAG